jgi:hypothetical protein
MRGADVQANEPTSRLIFVHLFEAIEKVPRDFEAFAKSASARRRP